VKITDDADALPAPPGFHLLHGGPLDVSIRDLHYGYAVALAKVIAAKGLQATISGTGHANQFHGTAPGNKLLVVFLFIKPCDSIKWNKLKSIFPDMFGYHMHFIFW
jgi:hypothetical protein